MSKSKGLGFVSYLFLASFLAVIFDYVLHVIWLERAGILPREGSAYYFTNFLIVLLTVALFSNIFRTARPVVLGFLGSMFAVIYYIMVKSLIPLGDTVIVFIAHWLAISLATGIADGFIRSYELKGVRR